MEPLPFLGRRLQTAFHWVPWTWPLFLTVVLFTSRFLTALPWGQAGFWLIITTVTVVFWSIPLVWLRESTRPLVLGILAGVLVLGAVATAGEWSWFLMMALPRLGPETLVTLTAASSLLLCAGVWMLAAFPLASAGWVAGMLPGILMTTSWPVAIVGLLILAFLVTGLHRQFLIRLRAEAQATVQTQLVELLLHDYGEGSQDWVWETDRSGVIQLPLPSLARQLGRSAPELVGLPFVTLITGDPERLTVEDEEELSELTRVLGGSTSFHDLEVPVQVGGHHRRWRLSGRPLRTSLGAISGWLGVGTDITEVQRIHNLNARLALLDNLTGLANRHRLQAVLHDYLTPRTADKPAGLILIDLQNFRMINEGLGHEVGDNLLKEVARRLRSRVPTSDLLARLGGDEFALLAPGAGDAALEGLMAAVRSVTDEPFLIDDHRLEVTFQMGVAAAPRDAQGAADLLKCAELALHEAKLHRQGTAVVYQAEFGQKALDRIRLHNELKVALVEGQFELHYQPQVRMVDGTVAGSEALVRWRHPTRGPVPPGLFIPALEETGLIVPVGIWILEAACREALQWPDQETVAVNVSAVQFASRTFLESVKEVLVKTHFPPERLELEITESVMAQDAKQVVQTLNDLRGLGIRISLDDFGTGYSSLSYLRQLPLDKLKVDQSFVRVLDQDAKATAIVQAVLDLSRILGLKTTAEGVETEEQRDRLKNLGVDTIQGYFYSRPVPPAGLNEFRAQLR